MHNIDGALSIFDTFVAREGVDPQYQPQRCVVISGG